MPTKASSDFAREREDEAVASERLDNNVSKCQAAQPSMSQRQGTEKQKSLGLPCAARGRAPLYDSQGRRRDLRFRNPSELFHRCWLWGIVLCWHLLGWCRKVHVLRDTFCCRTSFKEESRSYAEHNQEGCQSPSCLFDYVGRLADTHDLVGRSKVGSQATTFGFLDEHYKCQQHRCDYSQNYK